MKIKFCLTVKKRAAPSEEFRIIFRIADQTLHNERGFNSKTNIWRMEGGQTDYLEQFAVWGHTADARRDTLSIVALFTAVRWPRDRIFMIWPLLATLERPLQRFEHEFHLRSSSFHFHSPYSYRPNLIDQKLLFNCSALPQRQARCIHITHLLFIYFSQRR